MAVLSSVATQTTERYIVHYRPAAGGVAALKATDTWTGFILLDCRGDVAAHAAAALNVVAYDSEVSLRVDKATLQALTLRVAAARLRTAPTADAVPVAGDRLLLRLMQDCVGVHFTDAKASLLLAFHGVTTAKTDVSAALTRLGESGRLREIVTSDGKRFFDTDLAPHWHVYDRRAAELHDVHLTGNDHIDERLIASVNANPTGLELIYAE
ncbi:MAG: hypothetical protein AAGC71_12630 [Pseudomonadota bacterium]